MLQGLHISCQKYFAASHRLMLANVSLFPQTDVFNFFPSFSFFIHYRFSNTKGITPTRRFFHFYNLYTITLLPIKYFWFVNCPNLQKTAVVYKIFKRQHAAPYGNKQDDKKSLTSQTGSKNLTQKDFQISYLNYSMDNWNLAPLHNK